MAGSSGYLLLKLKIIQNFIITEGNYERAETAIYEFQIHSNSFSRFSKKCLKCLLGRRLSTDNFYTNDILFPVLKSRMLKISFLKFWMSFETANSF